MITYKLQNFIKGWFVGGFEPTLFNTTDVEVAVQKFKKGYKEVSHYHKIATEITVIVSGKARMNELIISEGEIVIIEPGTCTDFETLEDTTTVVVKLPGVLNDKYLEENK